MIVFATSRCRRCPLHALVLISRIAPAAGVLAPPTWDVRDVAISLARALTLSPLLDPPPPRALTKARTCLFHQNKEISEKSSDVVVEPLQPL